MGEKGFSRLASHYFHRFPWDVITQPCPNFHAVEVRAWLSIDIPLFYMHEITYTCRFIGDDLANLLVEYHVIHTGADAIKPTKQSPTKLSEYAVNTHRDSLRLENLSLISIAWTNYQNFWFGRDDNLILCCISIRIIGWWNLLRQYSVCWWALSLIQ